MAKVNTTATRKSHNGTTINGNLSNLYSNHDWIAGALTTEILRKIPMRSMREIELMNRHIIGNAGVIRLLERDIVREYGEHPTREQAKKMVSDYVGCFGKNIDDACAWVTLKLIFG